MIRLFPGPVGVTEGEARSYARRLAAPDSRPIPLLGGLLRLYPFAPDPGGPSDHYQLVLDDSRHGTLRLATLTPNEVAAVHPVVTPNETEPDRPRSSRTR